MTTTNTKLAVWKTVKIGDLTDEKLWTILRNNRPYCHVCFGFIENDKFQVSKEATELDIVAPSCIELGVDVTATYQEICKRAETLGLELCPQEVSVLLWLKNDRSVGERTVIATDPIEGQVLMVVRSWYARGFYKTFTANALMPIKLGASLTHSQKEVVARGQQMRFAFVKPRKQE